MALKPHQVGLTLLYDGSSNPEYLDSDSETEEVVEVTEVKNAEYAVQPGDTLWGLAERFLGNGSRWQEIATANYELLSSTAKQNGYNFDTTPWLWVGETLSIPGVTTNVTTTTVRKKANNSNNSHGKTIAEQAVSFSYTDPASGESDSVSITLADLNKEWLGNLMPKKGSCMIAKLNLTNWEDAERVDTFNCGKFLIDTVSPTGRPLQMTIDAASSPLDTAFTTLDNDKTWEATTLQNIASVIASNAGLSLYYDADTIWLAELEQNSQPDSTFLKGLCDDYGLGMKVYNKKIVIFDIAKYEKKGAVTTIKETDMLKWSANSTIDGVYTGVSLEYTDPSEDSNEKLTVTVGDVYTRPYKISKQADSESDARLKAIAALNAANRKILTMSITTRGRIDLVASQNVDIEGLGKLDGKYFIDKAKHSVGSGYTVQYDLHLVEYKSSSGSNASDNTDDVVSTTFNIGDKVKITGVYYSSDSNQKFVPLITEGTIESVLLGTANPYLIYSGSTVIGWVNEGCMSK